MTRAPTTILATTLLAAPALANPVNGLYADTPLCDNHGPLFAVEELGNAPIFPIDELIDSAATFTQQPACPLTDNPAVPNALVVMTNLTMTSWADLFYVADPETTLTNEDGLAESALAPGLRTQAFRIDFLGGNRPLVFESMTPDGIFEPGETWHFIVQDYMNALGAPASAFTSLDFAGASAGPGIPGVVPSTGSIVQMVVPSPATASLLGLGVLCAARRRRG